MILCLEERQVTSSPRSETGLFNLIESDSIEITPSDCDGYYQNVLKYNRSQHLGYIPPYIVMTLYLTYRDRISVKIIMKEKIIYHLKYITSDCNDTLEISYGDFQNVDMEFKIYFSIGVTIPHFTETRFFLINPISREIQTINDWWNVLNLYVYFKSFVPNVVLRPKGEVKLKEVTFYEQNNNIYSCVAIVHLSRRIYIKYNRKPIQNKRYSMSVVLNIKIIKYSNQSLNEILYEVNLSGLEGRMLRFSRHKYYNS
ncbi:hypothetical protein RF11_10622 [Thelohanellus kitauei]|uniref:Uncharacterized protein n=1 Tax=Thelohanellus kitauei TaxID=669202 RepID=A0A0C2IUJ7_THEKT|nr:hypothetical protein RF11_10622 [Thelohanellus kitauei]